jgi:diguanylate cyclase (GGDEF)-like protein/PAS domain S-box-containing protein
MLSRLFGIRAIALIGMIVLTLLALGLAWYSSTTYEHFALENQIQSSRDILSIKTHHLIRDLNQRQKQFSYQLQNDRNFRKALAQGDSSLLAVLLEKSFSQVFNNSGLIHFKTLLIRDTQGLIIASAHEDTESQYNGCPVLIDQIKTLSGSQKLKPRYALCSHDGELYAEAMLSMGALKPKGFMHIIAYTRDQLKQLENEIHAPIQLNTANHRNLFQSPGWSNAIHKDNKVRPVSYSLYGDDHTIGLIVSAVFDFSDFNHMVEHTRMRLLIITVSVALVVLVLVILLLGLAFRPLDQIRNSVGALLTGSYTPIKVEKLPVELGELVEVYNELVHGMEEASQLQNKAEKELISERDFISTTLDSITNAVIVVDSKLMIQLANPAAERLLGDAEENLRLYPLDELVVMYSNRSATHIANLKRLLKTPQRLENLFIQQGGHTIELEMMASPMLEKGSEDIGHVLVFKDVTEDRKLRRKLSYEGRHDKLTGFLNRAAFERKFDSMVTDNDYTRNQHILVYLNLDQFKLVNDTCGNAVGDFLLKQVSRVIKANVRKSDLLARLGGDEFGILLPYAETSTAANTVNEILTYINQEGFNWEGREYTITASAALIPFGLASDDYSEKLANLTTARSIAKDNGGNQYYLIDDDDEKVQEHHSTMGWASGINKGFSEQRFKLYAQPIVPLKQQEKRKHYEILIRYQDEDNTIIRPGEFLIPAERFNLIEKIDRWVVTEVIRWLAANPQLDGKIQFSINLSGRSIGSTSFHRFLVQLLESESVDVTSLCFEITETAAVKDVEKSIEFIRIIKQLGAKFSLDDFGSGLSSFTYLKQFPVDYLKIDGVFIKDILHDAQSYDFVRSITEVGHCLGMKVIAEFVESKNMFHTLREAKVDYLQGYTIGKPAPIELLELPNELE